MKYATISPILLLCSWSLPCLAETQTSQPPGVEGLDDPNMSKRLLDYWADFNCFVLNDNTHPPVREQCKEACFPGGIKPETPATDYIDSSVSCWINGPESSFLSGKPLTKEELKESKLIKTIKTGYCMCNDPLVNFTGDFFIKSVIEIGRLLDKFMCPALKALDVAIEIGSSIIPGPGKAITTGIKMGVKTAKLYKHAYNAQDAAKEWASMFVEQGFGLAENAGCNQKFTFSKGDLAGKFMDFANASDELVPGLNYDELPCPKGDKASKVCKDKNGGKNRRSFNS